MEQNDRNTMEQNPMRRRRGRPPGSKNRTTRIVGPRGRSMPCKTPGCDGEVYVKESYGSVQSIETPGARIYKRMRKCRKCGRQWLTTEKEME